MKSKLLIFISVSLITAKSWSQLEEKHHRVATSAASDSSTSSPPPSPPSFVPSTGTAIGKPGYRAWVSLAKPRLNPRQKRLATNSTKHETIYNAPLVNSCDGDKRTGFIVNKDFYLDWIDDQCKPPPASSRTYADGFNNHVELPKKTDNFNEAGQAGTSPPLPNNYKLVWSDEFDGNSLDLNKWEYEVNCHGGGNNEEQCYVAHNDVLKVENGKLIMTAILAPEGYALMPYDHCNADPDSQSRGACTNRKPVRSSRIHTKNAKWKYGRFEMKAKIPKGAFLWPAFWMLPSNYAYGTWAASGEFDIMESRGQKPDEVGHALHYGAQWPNNVYSNQQYVQSDLAEDFMVYGMDWDQNAIRFFINNRYTYQVATNRNWTSPTLPHSSPYHAPGQPWDQDFIILLNLAVGGGFFPGAKFNPQSDPSTWTQPFIIDYVRVYQPS